MAGVKGKSGGPRANSGGKRAGAGRPRRPPVVVDVEGKDMLTLLQDIALGRIEATQIQVRAAVAAVQYTHTKAGDGKKGQKAKAAGKVADGDRFKPSAPPKLSLVN